MTADRQNRAVSEHGNPKRHCDADVANRDLAVDGS